MNFSQRTVFILTIVLFTLSVLFPPWLYEDGWNSAEHSAGFHFITEKPEIKPYTEMKKIFSIPDRDPPHGFSVKPDILVLCAQIFCLIFLTIGFLLFLGDRKNLYKLVAGGISVFLGLSFCAVCIFFLTRTHF
jgi:hypothetical protein